MHFTLGVYFQLHFRQFYYGSILYGPWLDCFHQQTELSPYWVTQSCGIRDIAWRQILKLLKRRKATARSLCHRLGVSAGWPSDVRTIRWALQGHITATLWAHCDYRKSLRSFLGQTDNLKPCVVLTIPVRGPYGDRTMSLRCVYRLRAYDFFQICHCAELNKIVEATMPVNPYDDRKVSLRRPHETVIWTS